MAKCKLIRSSIPAKITFENMHLAWTNLSPTSDYAAQQITLNIGDYGTYNKIRVEAHLGKSDNRSVYTEFDISDSSACLRYEYTGATNISVRRRDIINDGNNQITFGGGYFQVAGQTLLNDNSQLIPIRVYVYNSNPTAKVTAIASSVKTNAQNCMMSDGVTSVEDVLNYSTSEHVVGKWIDGSTLYEKTIDCGALPNGTSKIVSHNIDNINEVLNIENIVIRDDGLVFRTFESFSSSGGFVYYVTKTDITLIAASGANVYTKFYVTIRYTKTS